MENQPSEEELLNEDGLDPDDYVFVVNSEGKMKSVVFPALEDQGLYHQDLLKVFRFFGVNDPDQLITDRTLH